MLLRLILVAPAVSINQATNDNTPPVAHHYLELRAAGTLIRFTWWRVGRIFGEILQMAESYGCCFGCRCCCRFYVRRLTYVKEKTIFGTKHKILFLRKTSICLYVFMFLGMLHFMLLRRRRGQTKIQGRYFYIPSPY